MMVPDRHPINPGITRSVALRQIPVSPDFCHNADVVADSTTVISMYGSFHTICDVAARFDNSDIDVRVVPHDCRLE